MTDGQAGLLLSGDPGLVQADHALTFFAQPHQQDVAAALVDLELVARNNGNAAPGDHGRTKDLDGGRWNAAQGAFTAEGRNGLGMGQEHRRRLPDSCQQVVHVVGGWRPMAGRETHGRRNLVQQAEFVVVDQLPLLPLLHALDRQSQLLAKLVDRFVEDVGHARVNADDALQHGQRIFAWPFGIVHMGAGQFIGAGAAGKHVELLLSELVGERGAQTVTLLHLADQVFLQPGSVLQELVEVLPVEGQH